MNQGEKCLEGSKSHLQKTRFFQGEIIADFMNFRVQPE
jgi:hypothetical protein